MNRKRILLLEPDKEQSEVFAGWLEKANYEVKVANNAQEVLALLSGERFDGVIADTDTAEDSIELYQAVRKDARFSDIPIFILTLKTRIKEMARLLSAGVDGLLFKPFDVEVFSKQLEILLKESEFKKGAKKLLDRNYINLLIEVADEANREDFFLLAPAIFNKLILEKVSAIMGEQVIAQITKRINESIGMDYAFMKEVKFSGGQILMDVVNRASGDIPVKKLTFAFRDYVYAFLHLVCVLTSDILMEKI